MTVPRWRKYFFVGLSGLAAFIGVIGALYSPGAGAAALAGAAAVGVNFAVIVRLGGYFLDRETRWPGAGGRKKVRVALMFLLHLCIVPAVLISIFVLTPGVAVAAALGALGEATAGPFILAALTLPYR